MDYIIGGIIVLCVTCALTFIIRKKRRGESFCGENCEGCPYSEGCDRKLPHDD